MLKVNVVTGLIILAVAPVVWQLGRVARGGRAQVGPARDRRDPAVRHRRLDRRGRAALPGRRHLRPVRPRRTPALTAGQGIVMTHGSATAAAHRRTARPRAAPGRRLVPGDVAGRAVLAARRLPGAAGGRDRHLLPAHPRRGVRLAPGQVGRGLAVALRRPAHHARRRRRRRAVGRAAGGHGRPGPGRRPACRSTSSRPATGSPPARRRPPRSWSAAWWHPASTSPTSRCWPRLTATRGGIAFAALTGIPSRAGGKFPVVSATEDRQLARPEETAAMTTEENASREPELLLGPMLRYVGETEATVWVETDRECQVEILGRTAPDLRGGRAPLRPGGASTAWRPAASRSTRSRWTAWSAGRVPAAASRRACCGR